MLGIVLVSGCAPQAKIQKVMAREVPERKDDFIFENDLICYRAYGAALENETLCPGLDMWVKLPGELVADQRYIDDLQNHKSYHKDWGNGKDCYKVGITLGAGASAPFVDGKLVFPATNYRSSEVLSCTADEVVFVLHYPEWEADGVTYSLDKKFTLTAGSYFCKVEETYSFTGDELTVAAGIIRHDIQSETAAEDRFAIWEAASDQSQEAEDGMLGLGLIMPGSKPAEDGRHSLRTVTIKPGETVTYWFGSCWSKGDIKTAEDWFALVNKQ